MAYEWSKVPEAWHQEIEDLKINLRIIKRNIRNLCGIMYLIDLKLQKRQGELKALERSADVLDELRAVDCPFSFRVTVLGGFEDELRAIASRVTRIQGDMPTVEELDRDDDDALWNSGDNGDWLFPSDQGESGGEGMGEASQVMDLDKNMASMDLAEHSPVDTEM